jgi:bifunctional UDP-N-acetylglucosamine pyrophosphorylase/glucosamine-1-phosphate N-acetyltransferase
VLEDHLERGVEIVAPELSFIESGVEIAPGAVIQPFVVIRRGVSIAARCVVGPFAHLRPGTSLGPGARVGNFVETKEASLGPDSLALHHAFLGDATVGSGVNVGAGTVIANFDGRARHHTRIGDGAFIGSGSILVAPVEVGPEARTGAGAVVTRGQDVAAGETVVGVPARPLERRRTPSRPRRRRDEK